jgi:hypothetical protein
LLGLSKRGVGLEISEDAVRAVLLKKRGPQMVLAGVGLGEIPSWTDEQGAAHAVLRALKGAGARRRDPLVCSVGGPEVVIKHVRLPTIPLPRVLEAVRWHFKETGLLPEADALFDAQVLDSSPNGEMNILAVCAPRALVNKHLKLLDTAGIAPRHMDVGPLATLNAFLGLQRVGRDETVVLLSLSERAPFLCLFNVQSGVPLIRYFSERLKSPATIVEEIRTSVTYFQAELASAGASLRCAYCGREERFAELKGQIEGLFGLWNLQQPPALFDPLSILEWEKSILPPGKPIEGGELAQAVGLALRVL